MASGPTGLTGAPARWTARERAAGRCPNTRRAWTTWRAWTQARALPVLPAQPLDVRHYLLDRAAGRSLNTLQADTAGIAALHTAAKNAVAEGPEERAAD